MNSKTCSNCGRAGRSLMMMGCLLINGEHDKPLVQVSGDGQVILVDVVIMPRKMWSLSGVTKYLVRTRYLRLRFKVNNQITILKWKYRVRHL